mmetsp:Transcript_11722/g.13480  ORF Transcript_11722/g.13480 Transcript_11722/m.13480 type:complete len:234 (-) Transcript_11722:161-862(-)|eukprot:CAMPEP_0184020208 /NCGR_PEP_ID=MMETSP0954-20121128/9214_1 /TAXON_ID=627963 /ORGANISM="Aplanochytrium sp, Strain PBS07" /LENGTH=233 /DNA_ID=CAMNT_0026302029 /DNA_START=402 /DNA_END=1103 /DNA_ORIENTATION=-
MGSATETATNLTRSGLTAVQLAYQVGALTTTLLGKAVEGVTTTAITAVLNGRDKDESLETIRKHSVQYILMELDVEAKVSCAKTLVKSIHSAREQRGNYDSEYVEVCAKNVVQVSDELLKVLHRIYNELDAHRLRWFSTWRSPNVDEDIVLLQTMCKVFDTRLDTLVKCLGVPANAVANGEKDANSNTSQRLSDLGFFKPPTKDMSKYELEETSRITNEVSTETLVFSDPILL